MASARPRFDPTNGVFSYPIIRSYEPLKALIRPNGINLFLSKFGAGMSFAKLRRPVPLFISDICKVGIPAKIAEAAVSAVSIVMAPFHTLWFLTYKSSQNQSVNPKHLWLVIAPKQQERPGVFFCAAPQFHFAGCYGFNAAQVRDFIKPLKADNWEPLFHNSNIRLWDVPLSNMAVL